MHRLRIADEQARRGAWADALATLLALRDDRPDELIVHLRLREAYLRLGDPLRLAETERRLQTLRVGTSGPTPSQAMAPAPATEGAPGESDLVVVDPIFRGSRLYYTAMICEAAAAALPAARVAVLTRRDHESELFPSYRDRLARARLQPVLAVPAEMWYGRVPDEACRQIVDAMARARPGTTFVFAGFNEVLPQLAEQIEADGRSYSVHVAGYEYAAATLREASKRRALSLIAGRVRSLGCWLLDEGIDRAGLDLPGVDLRVMPDPIPHRQDDPRLVAARGERSAFIDTRRTDGCLALLAVGLQSSRKGLRDLIRAARELEQRRLPVRIFVSGKLAPGEEELGAQVREVGSAMRSRVEYVDDAEILRTYNACDAVLLPYARDFSGSSGVFAHAMAFGKPVIATDHGCVGWRTREFGTGLTYPAGDAPALVAAIETMLGWSDADWRAHGERCLDYYRGHSYEATLEAVGGELARLGAMATAMGESVRGAPPPAAPASREAYGGYAFRLDAVDAIRQICLLDTGIGSRNMGDHIIVDSIRRHLREAFPQAIFVTVPTHEYLGTESLKLIDGSDIRLVCGTNLLASHMDEYKQWKIGGFEFSALRELTLLGCGWWQYQEAPNRYTELLLNRILSSQTIHSVRDSYTAAKLEALNGKKVVNTTCPTLWSLTPEHLATVPEGMAQDVVTTLTDYKADPAIDRFMLDHLAARYRHVYVWIQGTGDFAYLKRLCAAQPIPSLRVVPATLEAYDQLLDSALELDYIGTRLHAGVRALQRSRRALILAVDNRAREISADTGLPCLPRERTRDRLESLLPSFSARGVRLPLDQIRRFLGQFA